jgi:hypothetical protein
MANKNHRKALEIATTIERRHLINNQDNPDIMFGARLWTQVALPYRNPGDIPFWSRTNRSLTLRMQPSLIEDKNGNVTLAYPFGILPRYFLAWASDEAYRTKSPELQLGDSKNEFLAKLGLHDGGHQHRRANDQMRRLFSSSMQVTDRRQGEQKWGIAGENFQIADKWELWFSNKDEPGHAALFGSTVTLSDRYFQDILLHPVPLDFELMQALKGSPMQFDIYYWMSYTYASLQTPVTVTWQQLSAQFGSHTNEIRKFRQTFNRNLHVVATVYPKARFEITTEGIKLRPSPPSVKRRKIGG